jgi:hypothetical protein
MASTVKQQVWSKIEALAEVERERDASLGRHQALDRVMKTAVGRELVAEYHGPSANMTPAVVAAELELTARREVSTGCRTWDGAVLKLAKAYADARPDREQHTASDNLKFGFEQVAKRAPSVWANYLHERGRAA